MYILYIIVLKIKLITNLHALSVAIHVPPNSVHERVCVFMRTGGLTYVGLRGENSIGLLIHHFVIYLKT